MPTILKIGYQQYVVKSEKMAIAALTALCGAVRVQSRHVGSGRNFREVFWPEERRDDEISIKSVGNDQLVARDPGETQEYEPPKQIGFGGQP